MYVANCVVRFCILLCLATIVLPTIAGDASARQGRKAARDIGIGLGATIILNELLKAGEGKQLRAETDKGTRVDPDAARIRALQTALAAQGHYAGPASGNWDAASRSAAMGFQTALGNTPTGTLSAKEILALRKETTGRVERSIAIRLLEAAKVADDGGVRADSNETEIRGVQSALKQRGLYAGPIDGDWGRGLKRAVSAFQTRQGAQDNGRLSRAQAAELLDRSAGGVVPQDRRGIDGGPVQISNAIRTDTSRAPQKLQRVADSAPSRASHPIEIVQQTGHNGRMSAVALSKDDKLALTGSSDGTLRLWDLASGGLLRFIRAHEPSGELSDGVVAVGFAPDGRRFYSSNGVTTRLWDATTGKPIADADDGEIGSFASVIFSPDGHRMLSVGGKAGQSVVQLNVRDAASGRMILTRPIPSKFAGALAFSPDGSRVLFGGDNVQIWDSKVARLEKILFGHSEIVKSVAFSRDGKQILSAGFDTMLRLWDSQSGGLLRTLSGHVGGSLWARFLPDGRSAISMGNSDGSLREWDLATGALRRVIGGTGAFSEGTNVALTADGRRLFATGPKGLQIWDIELGKIVNELDVAGAAPANWVTTMPDGRRLMTDGRPDGGLRIWDLAGGRLERRIKVQSAGIGSYSVSSDARRALTGALTDLGSAERGELRLTDTDSGRLLQTFRGSLGALSPDGTIVLSHDRHDQNRRVELWDAATGKSIRTLTGHRSQITAVAFSPDGKTAISGGGDIALHFWDVRSGSLIRVFEVHPRDPEGGYLDPAVTTVAFSPDQRYVAAGTILNDGNSSLRLWTVADGKIARSFDVPANARHGEGDGVTTLAFSPDGHRLLSGSGLGNSLLLWDVGSGKRLKTFEGHAYGISSAGFLPDGKTVVASSYDGTIRLWNTESGSLLATMSEGKDGNWTTLIPEGFFSTSSGSAAPLNIVRGLNLTTIGQLHQSLYNPDLVREKLAGDPNGEVRSAGEIVNLETVINSGPAPTAEIISHGARTRSDRELHQFRARITDRGKGIGRIEWRINGVTAAAIQSPMGAGKETSSERIFTQTLALEAGSNIIEVVAYNAANLLASLPSRVAIEYTGPRDESLPTLHVLAIGINAYADPGWAPTGSNKIERFGPLTLAVKDALGIAEALHRAGTGLYKEVRLWSALDEDATRKKLDQIMSQIAGEVHPRDTFILFAAAHGIARNGHFYIIPQDFKNGPGAIEAQGIGQDHLQDWLGNRIRAKKALLMLDTCESGALIAGHLRSRAPQGANDAGVGRLHEATGRPVLTAAASGQFAHEGLVGDSGERHGVFTFAVLDALRRGDANANAQIELSELVAHVQSLVPSLAARYGGEGRSAARLPIFGEQAPRFGSRGEDFSIGRRLQ